MTQPPRPILDYATPSQSTALREIALIHRAFMTTLFFGALASISVAAIGLLNASALFVASGVIVLAATALLAAIFTFRLAAKFLPPWAFILVLATLLLPPVYLVIGIVLLVRAKSLLRKAGHTVPLLGIEDEFLPPT
jgi:hypothetical protein